MLADLSTVAPDHLKDAALIFLALASPAAAWLGLYYGRRRSVAISPQPIQVQGVERFVTKELCDQLHVSTAREVADIKARVTALENGQRQMVDDLGDQINLVRSEVSDGLRRVHERVDGMPAQIVVLLRNTGAITDHHRP
jgi:hypothetical protein